MGSSGPFPPEIIEEIVHYLTHNWVGLGGPSEPPPPLGIFRTWRRIPGSARYASVSKTWQDAVERETFADLRLDLGRLAEADAILNRVPRRQKYVRTIRLNVVLPPRADNAVRRVATAEERKQNNRALQDTFEAFMSTLRYWTPGPPVKLSLDAFAVKDTGSRVEEAITSSARAMYLSPLELEDPERVLCRGPVKVVTEVTMERNMSFGIPISGAAVCALLAGLPAAKKVFINWWDQGGNPKARSAFAHTLANVTHPIDRFYIAGTYTQRNRQQPAQQTQQCESKPDELSQSLGVLSQRLYEISLYDVVVSDALFLQHSTASEMASSAHWACLKNFGLYYPPVTPSGERLFYPDPSIPDRRKAATVAGPAIQRRYLAAARAALEMPLLKDMTLVAQLGCNGDWHKFWYNHDTRRGTAKVLWTSSSGFVPEDEVLAAWREVPRKHSGVLELEVEILDDEDAV
ncbi:hypothetical protein SLS62_001659 [Diatrype stigma]|uniref:DUF6546 domain-containing protein n=1 Tax=Diatrype stigma TaxID=117547 RepID=A0AAN9UXZ7_9PEZI